MNETVSNPLRSKRKQNWIVTQNKLGIYSLLPHSCHLGSHPNSVKILMNHFLNEKKLFHLHVTPSAANTVAICHQ